MDPALISAAMLARHYFTSRSLSDTAIDLVNETHASVCVTRGTEPDEINEQCSTGKKFLQPIDGKNKNAYDSYGVAHTD